MSLEHFAGTEGKDILTEQKEGSMSQGHRSQPERVTNGQTWNIWATK